MSADGVLIVADPAAGAVEFICYPCTKPIGPDWRTVHAACIRDGVLPYQIEVIGARSW